MRYVIAIAIALAAAVWSIATIESPAPPPAPPVDPEVPTDAGAAVIVPMLDAYRSHVVAAFEWTRID